MSLGDLDGPSGVTTKDGELVNGVEYLLITNSDAKQERLNTTPEMFVFRIDSAGIGLQANWYSTIVEKAEVCLQAVLL